MSTNHLDSHSDLTGYESIICGASAGLLTRFFVAPLDLVKIRMQLRQHSGFLETVSSIAKKEGIRAFWKGNAPAEGLYVAYSAVQFSVLQEVNHRLGDFGTEQTRQLIAGGIAGSTATLVSYPLDFLRTRVAANTSERSSLLPTVINTWQKKGIRGFFHGATATVASVFPYMALFFGTYSYLRDEKCVKLPSWLPPIFTASSIASLTSKATVYPLDTIRKRVQVHGIFTASEASTAGYGQRYSHNFVVCGAQIVSREGFRGLYHGIGVSLLKSWPGSVLSIVFFESTLRVLRGVEQTVSATR